MKSELFYSILKKIWRRRRRRKKKTWITTTVTMMTSQLKPRLQNQLKTGFLHFILIISIGFSLLYFALGHFHH